MNMAIIKGDRKNMLNNLINIVDRYSEHQSLHLLSIPQICVCTLLILLLLQNVVSSTYISAIVVSVYSPVYVSVEHAITKKT